MGKQIFAIVLILVVCLQHVSKAETVNSIKDCNGQKCFSNVTDVSVSDDGSFFLIIDSVVNPYVRKIDFSSGAADNDLVLPINESNQDLSSFMTGISNNGKKAFVFTLLLRQKLLIKFKPVTDKNVSQM